MKCEIIKDLIPLCLDEVCSDESEAEIKEHIKTCDNCRLLYESVPQTKDVSDKQPEEVRTFRKVNRKIKHSKWKIGILSLLLIVILCPIIYLTYGQITKKEGCKSFETVIRSIEVKKIAEAFAYGDAETFVNSLCPHFGESVYMGLQCYDELTPQDIQNIKDTYNDFIQGKEVESIKVESYYGTSIFLTNNSVDFPTYNNIVTEAEIHFTNCSEAVNMIFMKDIDGNYNTLSGIRYDYNEGNRELNLLWNAVSYANNHDVLIPKGVFEKLLAKNTEKSCKFISMRFNADYREAVNNSLTEYREKGFEITNAVVSPTKLDDEKKQCYYDITLTGADPKGTAVMTTRLYHDYCGLYPPEPDMVNVYTNGCTDELAEALAHIFG